MTTNKHEVYVLTPQVLSELKDCIAYADTLSCYKILSELKPVDPVGYLFTRRDYIGSVVGAKGDWAPYETPIYTIGEQP